MPEVPIAGGAAVYLFLIAVLYSQVELGRYFRIKNLLTQSATKEHKGMHVEKVLLQVIH